MRARDVASLGHVAWWSERVVPRLTDASLSSAEVGPAPRRGLRGAARPGARARVRQRAEPGAPARRGHLAGRRRALGRWPGDCSERRRRRTRVPVDAGRAGRAAAGRRRTAAYDAALSTFTLCTIPDRAAGARGGTPGAAARRRGCTCWSTGWRRTPAWPAWQHRLDRLQRRLVGGCHLPATCRACCLGGARGGPAASRSTCPARASCGRGPTGSSASPVRPGRFTSVGAGWTRMTTAPGGPLAAAEDLGLAHRDPARPGALAGGGGRGPRHRAAPAGQDDGVRVAEGEHGSCSCPATARSPGRSCAPCWA